MQEIGTMETTHGNAITCHNTSPRLKSAIEILDYDARPSFLVNRAECHVLRAERLPVIYHNPSLARNVELCNLILKKGDEAIENGRSMAFRYWIIRSTDDKPSTRSSGVDTLLFHGIVWTVVHLQDYLLISGLPHDDILESCSRHVSLQDANTHAIDRDKLQIAAKAASAKSSLESDGEREDATQHLGNSLKESVARTPLPSRSKSFRGTDWSSTRLGPMETWPQELHIMSRLVLSDTDPALLYWGDDLILMNNPPAAQFFPMVQGVIMGSTVKDVLPELWSAFATVFATVQSTRQVVKIEDAPFLVNRHGRLDECFASMRFIPIENSKGELLGIYETAREVTKEILSQRRLSTLLEVSTCSNNITEEKIFWKRLLHALSSNKEDVGFALVYSLADTISNTSSPSWSEPEFPINGLQRVCTLEGVLGLPEDHVSVKGHIDIDKDSTSYSFGFRQALIKDMPILLQVEDGTLEEEYMTGLCCRGYSSSCSSVVVCPIRPTGGHKVVGFLIMGLSSRVAYDDNFRQFIDILNRQIATSVASVFLFNEEIRRERKRVEEAALVHAKLQQRLEQKTNALLTSEAKFERMADKIPIGISITSRTGQITYANKAWYKTTGHSGADISAESWVALLHDDDVPIAIREFEELARTKEDRAFEIRLKKEWVREIKGAEPIKTATWVIASAYTEEGENGEVEYIIGALTDISAQKWAEETHRIRMLEALELKRQQESFIDTISHEMRNPLSAILQSADEVSDHLAQEQAARAMNINSIRGSIEAIETIMLCCQHQRRVIDDVLTLSKMNTDMLVISPVDSDPLEVVTSIVRMFSGDAKKKGITLVTKVEDSLKGMNSTRLLFDPSRVSQVLVNLMGNAIKFTRDSPTRQISVFVGIFDSKPANGDHGVQYVETKTITTDKTGYDTKIADQPLYLRIAVQDTGVGMVDSEKKKLFQRFTQASPRTHVQYGGSGLGLFISKKLTELQGGAIGLKMGDHKGTTFAFYVAAHRPKESSATATKRSADMMSEMKTAVDTATDPKSISVSRPLEPDRANSGHSLLVVEDNLINQRVICKQLRKKGYVVYAANHGAEALKFLEQTRYWKGGEDSGKPLSLILLDIEMPVMDGLTCVRKIRQLEAEGQLNGHIPVISVSANARLEQVEEAKLAGMDDNVSKPFQVTDLIPKIDALLALNTR